MEPLAKRRINELNTPMITSFREHVTRRELAKAGRKRLTKRALNEMTARRSFDHSMGKFQPQVVNKPTAIITAWRGELLDPNNQPYPEAQRRRLNDEANRKLAANIQSRGLSFYPVVGAGEEEEDDVIAVNKENSFIVQPIGDMDESDFIRNIQELLFDPTGQGGAGPFPHTQWGATVKLPSNPQAFELRYLAGNPPTGPHDYNQVVPLGDSAGPRIPQDKSYTQLMYGPRADSGIMDPLDQPGNVGNIGGLPGKRFAIKNKHQP